MDNVGFLVAALATGLLLALAPARGTVFGVAAAVAAADAARADRRSSRDQRPAYAGEGELSGVCAQTALGFRTLLADPRAAACSARC